VRRLAPLLGLACLLFLAADSSSATVVRLHTGLPQLGEFPLAPGYLSQNVLSPTLRAPMRMAMNSSDDIVVIEETADRLLQVHYDGSVTEYAAPVPGRQTAMAFDGSDNLLVVDGFATLWKIAPDGSRAPLATGVHHTHMDVAPSGDIYVIGTDDTIQRVQHITPEGQVSEYAVGFVNPGNVAVSPTTGEVFVKEKAGPIIRVNADGTSSVLTDAVGSEGSFAFGPDGTLYNVGFDGVSIVSTVDGSITRLPWTEPETGGVICSNPQSATTVDSQGRLVVLSAPANQLVRFDLARETAEVIYLGLGYTRALAVAPDGGGVFVGMNSPMCEGHGKVIRIGEDNTYSVVVDDLPPVLSAITFDAEGLGYVSAMGQVYTFTQDGISSYLIGFDYGVASIAIHPQTGELWGTGSVDVWRLDSDGVLHSYPYSFGGGAEVVAFAPDGELYVYATTSDVYQAPVQIGLYRFEPSDSSFALVADLSTVDICCVIGSIAAGQDGYVYWIGYNNRFTPDNAADAHILRISPAGEVSLIANRLPLDPAMIAGDPSSNDLYFVCAGGVYRVTEADLVFLPFLLR